MTQTNMTSTFTIGLAIVTCAIMLIGCNTTGHENNGIPTSDDSSFNVVKKGAADSAITGAMYGAIAGAAFGGIAAGASNLALSNTLGAIGAGAAVGAVYFGIPIGLIMWLSH